MNHLLLDAVGAPAKDMDLFIDILIASPFVIAILIILFFKFLDRLSKSKKEEKAF